MADVEMPGKIPVMDGFDKLLEFILCFAEETVKISQLLGNKGYQDNQINKLGLDYRNGSDAKDGKEENNADKYAQFESFEHVF